MALPAGLYPIHPNLSFAAKIAYQALGLVVAICLLIVSAGVYTTHENCDTFKGSTYAEDEWLGVLGMVAAIIWIGMSCYFIAIYKRVWFYELVLVKRRLVNDVEDRWRGLLARDGNAISARTSMLAMKTDARIDHAISQLQ